MFNQLKVYVKMIYLTWIPFTVTFILTCLLCGDWVDTRSLFRDRRAFSYIANETACIVDNIIYHDGDPIPTDDPCESCKCRPPGFSCVLRECKVKPGCKAIRREGECCPEYQCGCEHNGKFFNDGDHIPNAESPCYSCYCQGSSITCALADCKFRFDCEPEYVPSECCPRYDHCQPETPFWTTTSKRPLITRITTMSTVTSPSPTTSIATTTTTTTTTTTSSPPPPTTTTPTSTTSNPAVPVTISTVISTVLPSQSTTASLTRETSASLDNNGPSSPLTTISSSSSPSPSPSTTTISSIYTTLAKDDSDTTNSQEGDKPSSSSTNTNLETSSPSISSTTTSSPIIKEATSTIKMEYETSTSPVAVISEMGKENDATTSDENVIRSSSISPSSQVTSVPETVEVKLEALTPIATSTSVLISTEKTIDTMSEVDRSASSEATVEVTTLSNIELSSPDKSIDGPAITSSESPVIDSSNEKVVTSSDAKSEETLTTPGDMLPGPSDSNQGSSEKSVSRVEVTTTVIQPENDKEDDKRENQDETGKEVVDSEESKVPNVFESTSMDKTIGESKSEESSNSSNEGNGKESSGPVTTIIPENETPVETTTVGLEDNYLTTRTWIPDSELRAEHKSGDVDITAESIYDTHTASHNESPAIPASSEEVNNQNDENKLIPETIKPNVTIESSSVIATLTPTDINEPDNSNNNDYSTTLPDNNSESLDNSSNSSISNN